MKKEVVIATHDGMFHPDDVFSVATLLLVLENGDNDIKIVRTRNEELIRNAQFVVDVGNVYDESSGRFDHHQAGGAGQRSDVGIKFASFGLVWKKYGESLCGNVEVAKTVDSTLVSSIDAGDNGQNIYTKTINNICPYLVDDMVYSFRPTWQEDISGIDKNFYDAVLIAKQILGREIAHSKAKSLAKAFVMKAYEESNDKRIVVLDKFYPSEEILAQLPEPLFSVSMRNDGQWNVKAIRNDSSSFKNRKDLPETWAGKRDKDFADLTGVPDAVFCHNGRFMAVAKTKEGALKLANLALGF